MAASSGAWRGVVHAFGRGMDPRAKDGARAHPMVVVLGATFHAAIFAAIVGLALSIADYRPPPTLRLAALVLQVAGIGCGLALFARRLHSPVLRVISIPDDYVSNLLVVTFLAGSVGALLSPSGVRPFLIAAAALLCYAPFGKIRHSVFFFVSRVRYGRFVGERGLFVDRSA